jgi:stage II sporulation protein D
VRLVPDSAATTSIEGLHSYHGTIELKPMADGLVVINRLSLERYLHGLNEVPVSWPAEALRAQAVAARTYALRALARPRAGSAATYGFDICATVQCQVFSGADVVRGSPRGYRWVAAVARTERMAVLHGREPILARYHSTSGGRTFDNEQIFPSEGPFPYLKGVRSTTEERSSLYRWKVTFTRRQLTRILRAGGLWPAEHGRLRQVRTVPSSSGKHYPDSILIGRRGRIRVTAEQVRVVARTWAPSLFPNRYPSGAPTASGRLPETFPSNRLEMRTVDGRVVVNGRGWGHGVGMSQWGAEGMARRGASFREILHHYYTGVRIARVDDPGQIRVGIDWGRDEVKATGSFRLVDGRGREVVRSALGTWRFFAAGRGAVRVRPPEGFGLPLEVGIVAAPEVVDEGEETNITVALSKPARVLAVTAGEQRPRPSIRSAGRRSVPWTAPREPGVYEVRVRAEAGRRRSTDVTSIEVRAAPAGDDARAAPSEPAEPEPGGFRLVLALALISIAVVLATVAVTMRRWIGRGRTFRRRRRR